MQLFSNRDTASVVALAPNIGLAGALARGAPSFGGADRDRTGGLLVANQALSQLSYSPNPSGQLLAVLPSNPTS